MRDLETEVGNEATSTSRIASLEAEVAQLRRREVARIDEINQLRAALEAAEKRTGTGAGAGIGSSASGRPTPARISASAIRDPPSRIARAETASARMLTASRRPMGPSPLPASQPSSCVGSRGVGVGSSGSGGGGRGGSPAVATLPQVAPCPAAGQAELAVTEAFSLMEKNEEGLLTRIEVMKSGDFSSAASFDSATSSAPSARHHSRSLSLASLLHQVINACRNQERVRWLLGLPRAFEEDGARDAVER